MAGRRVALKPIEWAKIAERVPEAQKPKFLAFRAKSDSYLRRMNANPENPPQIDWAYYKKTVPIPGMVDTFQKQYESLTIPYPPDTVSSQIDAQEQQIKKDIEAFKAASNSKIAKYQKDIEFYRGLLPYDQMTLEDFRDAHPEMALDPINNPKNWPLNEYLEDKPSSDVSTSSKGH
ncbi:hypothetical protein O3M35_011305 [Rhynocoris fuscipes]|uniref:ATP synthase subunit d, mitochondrial n=1 Tax=Rhynocoris fuscipes TaxID=488301 RepID=A0AAW1D2H0_9HEMI